MSRRRNDIPAYSTPRPAAINWTPLIVAALTFAVFAPLCSAEFTSWDDWATIHQNEWMNPPTLGTLRHYWSSVAYGLYAPVTYTVWAGLAAIARLREPDVYNVQLNSWVFHSANVVVHVVSAIAAWALLRRLVGKDWAAAMGALIFALHPVQVEAVGWASGMKDLLAGCFGVIALWRYVVRAQDRPGSSAAPDAIGTVALVLAMLSKPSAVVVPFVAMAIDRFALERDWRAVARSAAVWIVLVVPVLIVARLAQDVSGIPSAPPWARPLIAGDTYAFYLYKVAFPLWLGMDYGRRPNEVLKSAWAYCAWIVPVLVALLIASLSRADAGERGRTGSRWIAASALAFAIPILPVSGLATFQFQFTSTTADHYLYLAMLGPAMAVAYLLAQARKVAIARGIVAAVLLVLAVRSIVQTQVWHNDFTLFTAALEVNPESFVAYNNLGHTHLMDADVAQAANDPKRAAAERDAALADFQHAMRLYALHPNPYENAARVLAIQGRVEESIAAIEKSIEIRARLPRTLYPNYMEDHNRVGQVLLARGEYDRAIAHFEALLKLKPDHEEARKFLQIARERAATQPSGRRTKPET